MDTQLQNTTFGQLITILEQELELLQQLVDISQLQQKSLIECNADDIQKNAIEQQRISHAMANLEHQRFTLMCSLFSVNLHTAKKITLSQLVDNAPIEIADNIIALKVSMNELISTLQFISNVNRILALRGKNSVTSTLNYIESEKVHVINTSL